MISENKWFMEYQMLSNDEKEVYKEFVLDTEEKAIVLDYERFKSVIELIASNPGELQKKYSKKLNLAEEVSLIFNDECVYIAHYLKSEKCISEEIYNLVMQIDKQLELLSNEHNETNWTVQVMNVDKRWIKARELAGEKVQGITIIIDGKLKEVVDLLMQNNPAYKNYTEIVRDAFFQGINSMIVEHKNNS